MRPSGPEGRCQSNPVTVAVAAAVPGNPTKPDRPALSRIRPTDFNVSDGQAGSPPLQCPPSRFESLVAMIVGPASRRPIRALVDPRRAAHQSNAALVCNATWSRVFPSNTCVIGISPRSEPPKSWATSLTTRDHPIRTWPKSAENNEPPNHFTTRGKPRPTGVPGMALCQKDLTATRPAPHKVHAGLPREARHTLVLPATRQAAGAPSAWSQPFQSTHARPRRWCDAGPPGRQSVTAAQKAGAEGRVRNHSSALCSAHFSWAMEPTRIGTPPSPAGRRRYKHRSALCRARVSRTIETTRGTPPEGRR